MLGTAKIWKTLDTSIKNEGFAKLAPRTQMALLRQRKTPPKTVPDRFGSATGQLPSLRSVDAAACKKASFPRCRQYWSSSLKSGMWPPPADTFCLTWVVLRAVPKRAGTLKTNANVLQLSRKHFVAAALCNAYYMRQPCTKATPCETAKISKTLDTSMKN